MKATLLARREHHMREAVVVEILSHDKDTFVGTLRVEHDLAFLSTESNIFAHDIVIPKRKLKGGKDGDKAVVKIIQFPGKESKTSSVR